MTVINACCFDCGQVQVTEHDVLLMVCNLAPLSYYEFRCTLCSVLVRRPADEHVVAMLMCGGVRAQVWTVPAEAAEAHTGPALSYDDLLDFAEALQVDDRLAARLQDAP